MPRRCIVPGCSSGSGSKVAKHIFPRDPTRARKWQLANNSPNLNDLSLRKLTTHRPLICHLHFAPQDYKLNANWQRSTKLKLDAVPSLHLNLLDSKSLDTSSSRDVTIQDQQGVRNNGKARGKFRMANKRCKIIGVKRPLSKQEIMDAMKLVNTNYFKDLMSSPTRFNKIYTEMLQCRTLRRPSLEMMRLCHHVAETCPERAHKYVFNMLIK